MQTESRIRTSILVASVFAALLWWLEILEYLLDTSFHRLGVYPLSPTGLVGIVAGPLIHGSWQHIASNTLPLLLLGSILHYGYPKSRWWTLAIVWVVSGLGVWLWGRESYHYGASGLTHGMFFFLFTIGILRRDKRSSALLMVAFFMYGTMLLTIFPQEPGISYEYHFFGAVGGVLSAILFRRWDPLPERKAYSWEQDSPEAEDPIIGDEWKTGGEDPIIGDEWKTGGEDTINRGDGQTIDSTGR
ncbi:rhomboid family intramembrane serine protease [Exilibacterium tricleocarpae]|uniref:Rhomboid family intramembrane serine protease n=1 Tax=Exilibacterium tricleocarpae TaxID=2591008 RepID=A0A545T673_9GAMM|nr:rhomboid family intramembrane serine protease [Exilibacterium tricleocarpae]TQV72688.1 rhomboid family intramembrane serine protease [Exilibacterium tricleocarpae]